MDKRVPVNLRTAVWSVVPDAAWHTVRRKRRAEAAVVVVRAVGQWQPPALPPHCLLMAVCAGQRRRGLAAAAPCQHEARLQARRPQPSTGQRWGYPAGMHCRIAQRRHARDPISRKCVHPQWVHQGRLGRAVQCSRICSSRSTTWVGRSHGQGYAFARGALGNAELKYTEPISRTWPRSLARSR